MGLFGKKSKRVATENSEVTLEDGTTVTINASVDCIGDSCPRPQLMTKAALGKASSGDTIEVKIDNPTSMEAIPPMMPELQARHLATIRKDRHWQLLLRKN
jgi:tRNA 2-thiouridine synthesizing protein A